MELAIPWPQASITPEYKTGGVLSYCRAEAMLPAAWSSLGSRGGSVTGSHLTQVTQAQSGKPGALVGTWTNTLCLLQVTHGLYLVFSPAQAQEKMPKKQSDRSS